MNISSSSRSTTFSTSYRRRPQLHKRLKTEEKEKEKKEPEEKWSHHVFLKEIAKQAWTTLDALQKCIDERIDALEVIGDLYLTTSTQTTTTTTTNETKNAPPPSSSSSSSSSLANNDLLNNNDVFYSNVAAYKKALAKVLSHKAVNDYQNQPSRHTLIEDYLSFYLLQTIFYCVSENKIVVNDPRVYRGPQNNKIIHDPQGNHISQNNSQGNHVSQNDPQANHLSQNNKIIHDPQGNHISQNDPQGNRVSQNDPQGNRVSQNDPHGLWHEMHARYYRRCEQQLLYIRLRNAPPDSWTRQEWMQIIAHWIVSQRASYSAFQINQHEKTTQGPQEFRWVEWSEMNNLEIVQRVTDVLSELTQGSAKHQFYTHYHPAIRAWYKLDPIHGMWFFGPWSKENMDRKRIVLHQGNMFIPEEDMIHFLREAFNPLLIYAHPKHWDPQSLENFVLRDSRGQSLAHTIAKRWDILCTRWETKRIAQLPQDHLLLPSAASASASQIMCMSDNHGVDIEDLVSRYAPPCLQRMHDPQNHLKHSQRQAYFAHLWPLGLTAEYAVKRRRDAFMRYYTQDKKQTHHQAQIEIKNIEASWKYWERKLQQEFQSRRDHHPRTSNNHNHNHNNNNNHNHNHHSNSSSKTRFQNASELHRGYRCSTMNKAPYHACPLQGDVAACIATMGGGQQAIELANRRGLQHFTPLDYIRIKYECSKSSSSSSSSSSIIKS